MGYDFTVTQLGDGFWQISEPGYARPSHAYLLAGSERAALIDSGLGFLSMRDQLDSIVDGEILVLQTHAHPDHAGGSHEFDTVRAHPAAVKKLSAGWANDELRFTIERYFEDREPPGQISARKFEIPECENVGELQDRGFIDLGDRQIDVFFTPGHSKDSVCYLELESGLLFTGDSLLKGQIAIEDSRSYRRSIREIMKLAELSSGIYPGHGPAPVEPGFATTVRHGFMDCITDRHPSGFLAGFATYRFEEFGIMLPPRSRRMREV